MEKLLFVILALALSRSPASSAEWALALHAGDGVRAEVTIESSGRIRWRILLRERTLRLTGAGNGCTTHGRPCHA